MITSLAKTIIGGKYYLNYLWNDKYIGQRIALGKYEPYLTKLILRQASTKGGQAGCVVDVGANIGYYSVLLAEKLKTVYAYEPEKVNFEILEKNIRDNKFKNVEAKRLAVGSKNAEIKLVKSKENYGDHRVFNYELRIKNYELIKEETKIIRLDDEIKEKVDLIKIDTQGWEPEVILGAKKIIEKDKPVIFLEYWPWAYKKARLDDKEMIGFLRKVYGKIYFIDEYVQTYFLVSDDYLEKYCVGDKACSLMVSSEVNYWNQIKDVNLKKLIKGVIKSADD